MWFDYVENISTKASPTLGSHRYIGAPLQCVAIYARFAAHSRALNYNKNVSRDS